MSSIGPDNTIRTAGTWEVAARVVVAVEAAHRPTINSIAAQKPHQDAIDFCSILILYTNPLWRSSFDPTLLRVPMDFSDYQAILLDLDGTLYHEEHALPGAVDLIRRLQAEGRLYACLSNSTSSPVRITERLMRLGMSMDPDHVYSAAAATADFVIQTYAPRPRVFNLSTESMREMLEGMVDWVQRDGEPCHAVVAGSQTSVHATEERQRIALGLLRKGAQLVGICADRVYPSPRGLEFGVGALSAMLAYAANCQPVFCGKPQPVFFNKLCQRLNVDPARCLLIGDNLEADIMGAKNMGMKTLLTLTGVTRRRDLLAIPSEWQPDGVVEDLTEV
jgi:HAD superfamily hydrolase (TIGR01450 family)